MKGLCVCLVIIFANRGLTQKETFNVSYGSDPEQTLDIYEPLKKPDKGILLIHGGAWVEGKKEDMNILVPVLKLNFNDHIIANMNYRLANLNDSSKGIGFPKQIDDVQLVVNFLKKRSNNTNLILTLIGASAGAHLAMLYGYGYDNNKVIKVIVNYVGPVDFTAWDYASNMTYNDLFKPFIGNYNYWDNPALFYRTSPVAWINRTSPKTISFYGDNDPLIPNEQGELLTKRLNQAKIKNEFHRYKGGHGSWSPLDIAQSIVKFVSFIKNNFK